MRGESAVLPAFSDDVWTGRYVPRGVLVPFRGQAGTPAPYALDLDSLVVSNDGVPLRADIDYIIDSVYGTLCLPPGDAAPSAVSLDYRYTLLRIDAVVRDVRTGRRSVRRGVSHLTSPHPPRPADDEIVEEHRLIDARDEPPQVFVPTSAVHVQTGPHCPGLPRAARRLAKGEALRLLFLGDSITEGGDASTDDDAFRAVAARALSRSHPGVDVRAAATGGSRSVQWLDPEDPTTDWRRVVDAEPQVTLVEFFNDAYLDPERWEPAYDDLIARLRGLGSEVVLMTPTFAMRSAMNGTDGVDDGRPYVRFLREYAQRNGVPLIDVSARWEQLRLEGLPYWTLLANGINHPDDRGHRLTGEFVGLALSRMLDEAHA